MSLAVSAPISSRFDQLSFRVALQRPGGRAGPSDSDVRLNVNGPQHRHWLASGHIGTLADAYVHGDFDLEGDFEDLIDLASELAGDRATVDGPLVVGELLRHLFGRWLDLRRVHACAHFEKPSMTLAQDQDARLEHMCRKLQLRPGQLLLDIGAGWGDLLFWAAEHHGVQAMGITQSRDQHAYVNDLITQKGLQGRVAMRLLDCRDLPLTPRFDRIASVGMFQHVDSAQLDSYFKRLHSMLKPGGLLLKHGLTAGGVEDHRLGARGGHSFDKHIFSGDQLVNVSHMGRSLSASGLALQDAENLGPHYARTLRVWLSGLEGRVNQARALTSGTSLRAWRLYLAGFAVALERGWLSIHQLLATRPPEGVSGAPLRCAPSTHVGEASHS